jgi:hypothetical protein
VLNDVEGKNNKIGRNSKLQPREAPPLSAMGIQRPTNRLPAAQEKEIENL